MYRVVTQKWELFVNADSWDLAIMLVRKLWIKWEIYKCDFCDTNNEYTLENELKQNLWPV